ncbi:protein of unknown function DUF1713 [Macleaya cordata]|uniref:Small ribosomal subunit protein mS38 n=1 Tax=Macleaya cordata TaxID=56857 RepID=A0A200R4G7_MACCD|nr:protein of unknown function DUF1713 [Macleaya cordata]
MAGVVHKLLRKSSLPRIITTFNNHQSLNLSAPLVPLQPHLSKIKPDDPCNLNPPLDSLNRDKINSSQALQIYPSFSFGYFLNPISPNGLFDQMETEEVDGSSEDKVVWADSVKKKRKKKMNKHKYKKLRKRLRRQT